VPAKRDDTPRKRIATECTRRGTSALVTGCLALLSGHPVDDELILALGGLPGAAVLDGYNGGRSGCWPRVWAARALLYAWDDDAISAVMAATEDDAWRVREMAAKVIAHQKLGDALQAVAKLRTDPVPRVRDAGERAVRVLAEARA
jgi:hypothetical protein